MKINDFFQKGYYINLDYRTDRKAQFEQEVKQIGLEGFFERVPGIDVSTRQYPNAINQPSYVNKGMACGEAFYNAYKKANESGYERVLIYEDDILFYNDGQETGLQLVEKALDQLQNFPDWDMIYFGGYLKYCPGVQVSENLLKADNILTAHAVGYNKKVFEKLLQYVPGHDCIYDEWIAARKNIIKYIVYPLAVAQREGKSDIDAFGKSPDIKHWLDCYSKFKIIKP